MSCCLGFRVLVCRVCGSGVEMMLHLVRAGHVVGHMFSDSSREFGSVRGVVCILHCWYIP